MFIFVVYIFEGEIKQKLLRHDSEIQPYLDKKGLIREECNIYRGERIQFNSCHKQWQYAIPVTCGHCKKDLTGWGEKIGKFPCNVTCEEGCPDKGDGGY